MRVRQYIQPSGWHFNHGKQIYNRGHLIAYSVSAEINQQGQYSPNEQSGDQNNPKNLFTQTAYTNQKIQTIYENKVRQALQQNKKVIYSATTIFRGTERMARGIDLQAITTDKTLNFNVYIFNVQPAINLIIKMVELELIILLKLMGCLIMISMTGIKIIILLSNVI